MRAPDATPARPALPGLDPAWSRLLTVADADGVEHCWHVLDNGVREPVGTLLCVHGNPTWSYLWRGCWPPPHPAGGWSPPTSSAWAGPTG